MILEYSTQKQLNTNWCWAALGSGISRFYDGDNFWPQKNLAATILNRPECADHPGGIACNQTFDLVPVLNFLDHYAGEVIGAITLKSLKEQIDAGNPICCQFQMNTNATHFVAVFGYEKSNVIVGDPQVGNYKIGYNSLFNYRGGKWIRTMATVE